MGSFVLSLHLSQVTRPAQVLRLTGIPQMVLMTTCRRGSSNQQLPTCTTATGKGLHAGKRRKIGLKKRPIFSSSKGRTGDETQSWSLPGTGNSGNEGPWQAEKVHENAAGAADKEPGAGEDSPNSACPVLGSKLSLTSGEGELGTGKVSMRTRAQCLLPLL